MRDSVTGKNYSSSFSGTAEAHALDTTPNTRPHMPQVGGRFPYTSKPPRSPIALSCE